MWGVAPLPDIQTHIVLFLTSGQRAGKNVPEGHGMNESVDWCPFAYPVNLTMQRAASMPRGFGDKGMPVAFRLVGRRYDDATVLRAARAYEKAHPFAMPEGYV